MRHLLSVLLVVALTACAQTSTPAPAETTRVDGVPFASFRMELADVVGQMATKLRDRCPQDYVGIQGLPGPSPQSQQWQCMRFAIDLAIFDADGPVACEGQPDVGKYIGCLVIGSFFNEVRRNIASPRVLSTAEWTDLDKAADNLGAEMVAQQAVQCRGNSGAICTWLFNLKALGLSAEEGRPCLSQMLATDCLLQKSMLKHVKAISENL